MMPITAARNLRHRGLLIAARKYLSSSSADRVLVDVDDHGIARVTLNRSDKRNAMDLSMFQALVKTAVDLKKHSKPKVVIMKGDGPIFCAGLDVNSFTPADAQRLLGPGHDGNRMTLAQSACMAWREVEAPILCCLEGAALGGGLQLALACDVRIATPDCQLGLLEGRLGLIPDMGATVLLRELIPMDQAKLLTWMAQPAAAADCGSLVTMIDDDPQGKAEELAKQIAQQSSLTLGWAKKLYQNCHDLSIDECLRAESDAQKEILQKGGGPPQVKK